MKIAGGICLALGFLGIIICVVVMGSGFKTLTDEMQGEPTVLKEANLTVGEDNRIEGIPISIQENQVVLYQATLRIEVEPAGQQFGFPYQVEVMDDQGKVLTTQGGQINQDSRPTSAALGGAPPSPGTGIGVSFPIVDETAYQQDNFRSYQAVATVRVDPQVRNVPPAEGAEPVDPEAGSPSGSPVVLKSARFLVETKEIPMAAAMGMGIGVLGACASGMVAVVGLVLLIIGLATGKKS